MRRMRPCGNVAHTGFLYQPYSRSLKLPTRHRLSDLQLHKIIDASWSDLLTEAQDIPAICAERPEQTTEIMPLNAWYGHDQIVKAYANWPPGRPLRILLPHAVEYSGLPTMSRRRAAVPVVAYYADSTARLHLNLDAHYVWPLAHPFVHLLALRDLSSAPPRKGTLFFPSHSYISSCGTDWVIRTSDTAALLARLSALPKEMKPVTVCSYWLDILLKRHEPYIAAGLRVVSAGHRADPLFLARLLALCATHQFAASNEIGSHTFYAVKAGCRYVHIEATGDLTEVSKPRSTPDLDIVARRAAQFITDLNEDGGAKQLQVADHMLGTHHLLPPRELAAMFRRAERLDRIGIVRISSGGHHRWIITGPWGMVRFVYRCWERLIARMGLQTRHAMAER